MSAQAANRCAVTDSVAHGYSELRTKTAKQRKGGPSGRSRSHNQEE